MTRRLPQEAEKYIPPGFVESTQPDMLTQLSQKRLEESEAWLIQLPPEISDVAQLETAEWMLDKEIGDVGDIGFLVFPDGAKYGIRVENLQMVRHLVVRTQHETKPEIKKLLVLYQIKETSSVFATIAQQPVESVERKKVKAKRSRYSL